MTTEELQREYSIEEYDEGGYQGIDEKELSKMMIEFAKFHVEAALKAASKLDFEDITHPEANDYEEAVEMTILECYPLDNIK